MTRIPHKAIAATVLAVLVALAAPGAGAAEPDPEHAVAGEVEVRLAEIEVMVTDRKGNPIPGLTREDFALRRDGEPVTITHFSAVAAGERVTALGPEPADDRLNLVIYVDRSYLAPGDLRGLREELKTFLRTALGPRDRVMLVTSHRSLELRQEFTTLPELVIEKLEAIKERPGGARLIKEYQDVVRDIRRVRGESLTLPGQDPNALIQGLLSRVEAFSAEVVGEIGQTAARIEHLARAISGLSGRKAVLYVGGRLPVSLSRALFDTWQDSFRPSDQLVTGAGTDPAAGAGGPAGSGAPNVPQVRPGFAVQAANLVDAEAERVVERLAAVANSSDVTFYGLDAGGLRRSSSFLSTADSPSIGATTRIQSQSQQLFNDGLSALTSLAVETGGMIFSGNQDFSIALGRIGRDFDTFYTLGFTPRAGSSGIEVKLRDRKKRKLRLRYRRALEIKDRDLEAAELTVSALLLDTPENPLAVEVSAGEAAPEDGGGYRVPVSITVPLARLALVAEGRAHQGRLTIFITSGRLDRLRPVEKALVPLRIANQDLLTSLGRRVEYRLDLTLPAGLERIAVTVRDEYRPMVSTTFATLEVGAPAAAAATATPAAR